MPHPSQAALEPRKSPVQARSAASVEAILEATVQVLLAVGKERLTTTRVAARAGVSVGTLYQYYPNKVSLLQSVLRRHVAGVAEAIERVCREQQGNPLAQMADALITAFLQTKMKDTQTSVALYAISADVDGLRIANEAGLRSRQALARMLASSSDPLTGDPWLIASVLQSAMAGVSRGLVESASPEKLFEDWRRELLCLSRSYLGASSTVPARAPASAPSADSSARPPRSDAA